MDFKEKKILGRTGLAVSRLGLASGYGAPAKTVEKAFHEYGINYFYWSTPRKSAMGEGLKSLLKDHREDIVIVFQSYDHIGITVKRSVHKGLKALGTEYADVILLGWQNWGPPKRLLEQSVRLREDGLVRHIAMSGHSRRFFAETAQLPDSPIDIFMLRYNAVHRGAERDVFPSLPEENRPGITVYTATCWGKLLNPKKMPEGESPLSAADCYRFVLTNPNVDLCMMGPRTDEEFMQGVSALEQGPLSEEEMIRIKSIGDHIYGNGKPEKQPPRRVFIKTTLKTLKRISRFR